MKGSLQFFYWINHLMIWHDMAPFSAVFFSFIGVTDLLWTIIRSRQPISLFEQVYQMVDDHLTLLFISHLLHEYLEHNKRSRRNRVLYASSCKIQLNQVLLSSRTAKGKK